LGGQLAVLVTVGLYVALPAKLTVWPAWLVPSLELVPLLAIAIAIAIDHDLDRRRQPITRIRHEEATAPVTV